MKTVTRRKRKRTPRTCRPVDLLGATAIMLQGEGQDRIFHTGSLLVARSRDVKRLAKTPETRQKTEIYARLPTTIIPKSASISVSKLHLWALNPLFIAD